MKRCPSCCEVKPVEDFYRMARSSDGRQGYCKSCSKRGNAAYVAANADRVNHRRRTRPKRKLTTDETYDLHLRRAFKMTLKDHEALAAKQGNRCAGCGGGQTRGTRLHVDHDHSCCDGAYTCGKCVRGLLCFKCNAALGVVGDNKETLLNLVRYLDAHVAG